MYYEIINLITKKKIKFNNLTEAYMYLGMHGNGELHIKIKRHYR